MTSLTAYYSCKDISNDNNAADLDRTCESLLSKAGEHNQFIRNDIVVTLSKIVEHGTPFRVLSALLNTGT